MTGIDRRTGQPIDTLSSALQGVEVILSTRIRSRLMRRGFGAGIVELLGRRLVPSRFAALQQLVATAIDLYEPRFEVRRIIVSGTVDELRAGVAALNIEADYRPGALKKPPDYRVDRRVQFTFSGQGSQLTELA